MGFVAAFDRVLFYNEASRFSVLRMKTADMMVPEDARSPLSVPRSSDPLHGSRL